MVFVDTAITPDSANSYTYVNSKQVYDEIAAAMTASGWVFVESVNSTFSTWTYRRYVWKCPTTLSGLPADFYVVIDVPYITSGGRWTTDMPIRVYLGETYSGGVLGKFATTAASVTLASDLTNPATFTLSTFTRPASGNFNQHTFGTPNNSASFRCLALVTKDTLIFMSAGGSSATPILARYLYVGRYERVFNATVDPMPLVITGSSDWASPTYPSGGCTRAPTFSPGAVVTDAFVVRNSDSETSDVAVGATSTSWELGSSMLMAGVVGNSSSTGWIKSLGGPLVSRLPIFPGPLKAEWQLRGLFRGYLKHLYGANVATHTRGDTFVVDGQVFVGNGLTVGPLMNTQAV